MLMRLADRKLSPHDCRRTSRTMIIARTASVAVFLIFVCCACAGDRTEELPTRGAGCDTCSPSERQAYADARRVQIDNREAVKVGTARRSRAGVPLRLYMGMRRAGYDEELWRYLASDEEAARLLSPKPWNALYSAGLLIPSILCVGPVASTAQGAMLLFLF